MDEVIENFRKRLKIVQDNDDNSKYCERCALEAVCYEITDVRMVFCEDAEGKVNRHFECVND